MADNNTPSISDSILRSIKKLLMVFDDDTVFDTDIIIHINSAFWRLRQLGAGNNDFVITGANETWADYLGEDVNKMRVVVTYVYLYVRLLFDPPTNNASLFNSYQQQLEKYESLIIYECDPHYE